MLKIKNLTFKNFLSVGNQTQAIDFNNDSLSLVLGENLDQGGDDSGSKNGTGKTTVINALSYALYGQALTSIKKSNLVNKTNGRHLNVTLTFEKNGTEYRIERGRNPSFLKFFVNDQEKSEGDEADTDESQGDTRKTQEYINEVLEMSHDMFKHIVALNTYTEPFLSMRAADQRAIIEQLLGITILSDKAANLKEKIRETKEAISHENARIEAIQSSNEELYKTIDNLKNKQEEWQKKHDREVQELESAIQELEKLDIDRELENHDRLKEWQEWKNKYDALVKEQNNLQKSRDREQRNAEKIEKELKDLNEAICYTCGQEIHNEKQEEIRQERQKELDDLKENIRLNDEQLQEINAGIKKIDDMNLGEKPETFYSDVKQAHDHRNNVETLKKELENKKNETDPYQPQIDELNESAVQEIDWTRINELSNTKEHQEFLQKLLTNKDSFIRKKIIDQNLAFLNQRLTKYLDQLGLPHTVEFQNDLSVEITQLGQDLDFDNLSRGERNRLILGLSFAFRDVWENLYQSINLLFIDELIDSGLDGSGVENALGILKKMGRERNKNIFLISHRDELVGRVDNILKVVKEGGFTSFENNV